MREQKPLHEKIILIFSYSMSLVYVLIGVGFVLMPWDVGMPEGVKIAFGVILIIYGLFRMVRAYKQSAD